jgi:cation diffusion facilitator family transporter
MSSHHRITYYAWLSIGTAVLTILLKAAAYKVTGSVGLLSDAMESGVNLATAVFSLIVLSVAVQPPDETHEHGHGKAEYFSSGVEGVFILIAGMAVGITAVRSLLLPRPLEQIGIGLTISIIAALFNLMTARILLRAGNQYDSITLTASAHHLQTDVLTSIGIVIGVGATALTGWFWLDPLLALLVALHILRTAVYLLRDSVQGLMDRAISDDEKEKIIHILDAHCRDGVAFHALRTRQSGAQRFISLHVQVPGAWSVQEGHELLEQIEQDLRQAITPVHILTHLEPFEDPISWEDLSLNRADEFI